MAKILVIGAHPDDETLGLGGTLKLHSLRGDEITVLIISDGESSRKKSLTKIKNRQTQAKEVSKILGFKKIEFLNYEDEKLDKSPILEIIQKIESRIKEIKPDIIYTHFWGDLNQDHRKVFEATLIATRPIPESQISEIICYETPSSTEYSLESFKPNLYVDISDVIKIKLKALLKYKEEIRDYPHPRSEKSIINRAQYWGINSGLKYAEGFISIRRIIR